MNLSRIRPGQPSQSVMIVLPLLFLTLLVIAPVLYAVWGSVHRIEAFGTESPFIGFGNYVKALQSPLFTRGLRNGIIYSSASTFLQVTIGLGLALAVHSRRGRRTFLAPLMLLPYAIPSVIASILATFLLDHSLGIVNHFLRIIGIDPPVWFSESWLMITLIGVSVWQFVPFVLLACLARLQLIPAQTYETASLDGASRRQLFRYVTLPSLAPVLVSVTVLRAIIMLMKFDLPWLIASSKGSGRAIDTPAVVAYRLTFEEFDIGAGFAVSVMYLAMLTLVLLLVHGSGARGRLMGD